MTMRKILPSVLLPLCGVLLMNCNQKANEHHTVFTKADSLTDSYLAYQDSMLWSWNIMINDDNQKINAMHNLLHELLVTSNDQHDQLKSYEEQLEQLSRLRYTQQSMGNSDIVEEYDFASSTLVSELISLAESKSEFAYNSTLQKLVDDIRIADQRVANYREEYDAIVMKYNQFLERNNSYLSEISNYDTIQKRHLFRMVAAE
jgi:hypothetical protein